MSSIRIKAQALEKKTVKLHWFGNVHQDARNNWRLGVAFEDKNQLLKIECPVGLLPMLRIGQWYHDGTPMATQKEGTIGAVTIPAGATFQQDTSLAVCRRFQYYLYRDTELIKQQMLSFTVHGVTYHIPQTEMIRAFFALYKVCSNAMLRPNGLSLLVNHASVQNQELSIVFAKEIPVSTLTDAFVQHIGWVISNTDIRISFESIYMQVYQQGMYLKYGAPLSFVVPNLDGITLTYRGTLNGNEMMVFEIVGIDGLYSPINTITYTHPLLKERIYVPGLKKRQIQKGKLDEVEVDTTSKEVPREDNRQLVIEQEPTRLGFSSQAKVVKVSNKMQNIHQGDIYVSQQGRGGSTVHGGVDESIKGGKLQAIDVQSVDVEESKPHGLEQFLQMIDLMGESYPELTISNSLIDLPLGRKFSVLPDGQRRKCAVVRIERYNRITYILEVSCPDGHSLSTLLLYSISKDINVHEKYIQKILRDLIYNQGHWKLKKVQHFSVRLVRHFNINIDKWVEKIYKDC
ncbi:Tn7-like element transposition protein TnsE [Aneurinibacillus migulanus]|uniref:TnsE C-terminal domain-containing protein n=1 Tax=Aneurinibacillus migulanus TaxID=47500 RepID=A0A0D1XP95_ANEMI|nr:Tn7-like element transposition protein TnsE [Aneurinibacillus migulanus]KIV54028.1 hypothetical protein TS65_19655 [Aneurinibacillus migulanus]KON90941.1 hypothetical protein AF333_28540 [Aneurinibacillus migulanus]MED0893028.1 Tn7-like element transposition protein TnsE [Aneurinibacillus migulanus]MED1618483.1 Tn7-like element transposition protein TnsE [Aneurinibacillus migulanus]SDK46690.1 hypothetical protein SAMN04487909_1582 [Aneurinibacillus migulanus]